MTVVGQKKREKDLHQKALFLMLDNGHGGHPCALMLSSSKEDAAVEPQLQ